MIGEELIRGFLVQVQVHQVVRASDEGEFLFSRAHSGEEKAENEQTYFSIFSKLGFLLTTERTLGKLHHRPQSGEMCRMWPVPITIPLPLFRLLNSGPNCIMLEC